MSFERLTVRLLSGDVFYFNAGGILGNQASRLDLLREAIDNDSQFSSPDQAGVERTFSGAEVSNYHLD